VNQTVAGIVVATLIAATAGGGLGLSIKGNLTDVLRASPSEPDEKAPSTPPNRRHERGSLKPLPVILTNLADQVRTGVRLEGHALLRDASDDDPELVARIVQDVVALLRTMELRHLEGASGLSALREELAERARLRSDGRVSEILIQGLIVE